MQQLTPSEISDIIRSRIESLDVKSEAQNEGTVVSVSDGIPKKREYLRKSAEAAYAAYSNETALEYYEGAGLIT